MMTKDAVAYDAPDVGEDAADEFGRQLIQYELRIRDHVYSIVQKAWDEECRAYYTQMEDLTRKASEEALPADKRQALCGTIFSTFEDALMAEHSVALDQIKMALLAGEREGFRLGVRVMTKLLTRRTEGAGLVPIAPDERAVTEPEGLQLTYAMVDDDYADQLILKLFGHEPEPTDPAE